MIKTSKKKKSHYTKVCTIRLTEEEYKELIKNTHSTNLTLSEYVRQLIKDNKIVEYTSWINRKELINEVNHIGVNINQIVKNVNSDYYSSYEKLKLFAMMKKLYELLDEKL